MISRFFYPKQVDQKISLMKNLRKHRKGFQPARARVYCILGWLVGIGAVAIPGVGPFIAAGPLMALMAGAGTGAAVGGIAGGLIGLGIPEYEAKRYENFVKDGGILLSVHIADEDKLSHAEQILKDTGAKDISSTTEVPEARMTHTTVVGVQPTTF
jgi:hypothetical protein